MFVPQAIKTNLEPYNTKAVLGLMLTCVAKINILRMKILSEHAFPLMPLYH